MSAWEYPAAAVEDLHPSHLPGRRASSTQWTNRVFQILNSHAQKFDMGRVCDVLTHSDLMYPWDRFAAVGPGLWIVSATA